MLNKHDRDNKKLKRRIQELEDEIEALKNETPTIIEDEVVVGLFQAIATINAGEYSIEEIKCICKETLSKTPNQIIDDVVDKYRKEGIEKAVELCMNKAEQARDLESELTAITAESIAEALQKL
jgi:hypothetical protein